MAFEVEPIGFIRLGMLLREPTPTEEGYSLVAEFMDRSIRKGLLSERLGLIGRLCTSMSYQLATEYRFKEALQEIPKLTDSALAPFDEIMGRPLSKRFSDTLLSFCQQKFRDSNELSYQMLKVLSDASLAGEASIQSREEIIKLYLHPNTVDELRTLADMVVFTNQSSGWILGNHPAERVQADLGELLVHLRLFDESLDNREIPAWLFFVSKLYARLMVRNVDKLSTHTIFHRNARTCKTALSLIRQEYPILWPTQTEPIAAALQNRNILLTAETGTGKSLLGIILIAAKSESKGYSVYMVPTRTLAHQMSDRIARIALGGAFERVRVVTMEDEVNPDELRTCKALVGTYEKVEGLIRENTVKPENVNLFVVDECHSISELSRGVTLDFLLLQMNPRFDCQRLLLSAVIPDKDGRRFADWAKAEYSVGRDWRRTKLLEKLSLGRNEVILPQDGGEDVITQLLQQLGHQVPKKMGAEDFVIGKALEFVRQDKVVLITAESRRGVEDLANRIAATIKALATSDLVPDTYLKDRIEEKRDKLYRYIRDLESSELLLPRSTSFIARLLARGVVFHHAGLPKTLRKSIEEMIANRVPLVVVSTTTLEAGVNFPVDAVMVKRMILTKRVKGLRSRMMDQQSFWTYAMSRYENLLFSSYRNIIGRAGRAGFAEQGESVFFVDNIDDARAFLEMRYRKNRTLGGGADLYIISRLMEISQPYGEWRYTYAPISRDLNQSRGRFLSSLLQVIHRGTDNLDAVISILKKTWTWKTLQELPFLVDMDRDFRLLVSEELEELVEMGFATCEQGIYELTQLGTFVNTSLLNPISAKRIIACLRDMKDLLPGMQETDVDFCILNAVGLAYEVRTSPFDRPRRKGVRSPTLLLARRRIGSAGIMSDELSVLLASVLYDWIKGRSVDQILTDFGLHDSDHGFLEEIIPKNALWVLHCLERLCQGVGCPKTLVSRIRQLEAFVSAGTDNEAARRMIELQIPGLARNSAVFIVNSLKATDIESLTKIDKETFVGLFQGKEEMSGRIFEQLRSKAMQ